MCLLKSMMNGLKKLKKWVYAKKRKNCLMNLVAIFTTGLKILVVLLPLISTNPTCTPLDERLRFRMLTEPRTDKPAILRVFGIAVDAKVGQKLHSSFMGPLRQDGQGIRALRHIFGHISTELPIQVTGELIIGYIQSLLLQHSGLVAPGGVPAKSPRQESAFHVSVY